MKVTVKSKEKQDCKIPFDDIPIGYVYVAGYSGGPVILKLRNGESAVLSLSYDNSRTFFGIAAGWKGESAHKILGKLVEIIVEEE